MMAKLKTTTITAPGRSIDLDQEMEKHLKLARESIQMDMMDCAVCCAYTEAVSYVIAVPYCDYGQKAKAKKALRKFINSHKVQAAVFTSEAWFRDAKDLERIIGEGICVAGRDACHYRVATQRFVKQLDGSIKFEQAEFSDVDESSSPNAWFTGCKFVA